MSQRSRFGAQLEVAIGDYMAVVAGKLLEDGLPVTGVRGYGIYDDDLDGSEEGSINFGLAFQAGLLPGGEAGLEWTGTSGWFFALTKGQADLHEGARWLGAGLVPSPERVAAFVSSMLLDPVNTGSSERPFYRPAEQDPEELLERLAPFALEKPYRTFGYNHFFRALQGRAYRDRVLTALSTPDDAILDLPIRRSELQALLHLIDYAEVAGAGPGVGDLVGPFAADLTQRIGHGHDSARHHRRAVTHAHEARAAEERFRRSLKPDPEE